MTNEEFLRTIKATKSGSAAPKDSAYYAKIAEEPKEEAGIGTSLSGLVEGLPGGAALTRAAGGAGAALGTLTETGDLNKAQEAFSEGYEETGKDIEEYSTENPNTVLAQNLVGSLAGPGKLAQGFMKNLAANVGLEGAGAYADARARGLSHEDAMSAAEATATTVGAATGLLHSRGLAKKLASVSDEAEATYKSLSKEAKKEASKADKGFLDDMPKIAKTLASTSPKYAFIKAADYINKNRKGAYLKATELADNPKLAPWKDKIEQAMVRGPRALIGTLYMINQEDPRTTDIIESTFDEE